MDSTTKIYLQFEFESGELDLGEAEAIGYKKRIDIDSFHFSVNSKKQSVKSSSKEEVSANIQFDLVTFSKVFDSASIRLIRNLGAHNRFKQAIITVDQQLVDEHERNEILFIYLHDGYIADIKMRTSDQGKAGSSIKEDVSLSFHRCDIHYYAYKGKKVGGQKKLGDDYRIDANVYHSSYSEQVSE
jgi:type VI protein secretion system component Hcp